MNQLPPAVSLVPGSPSFEEVHDAHVQALLAGLSAHTIDPDAATRALKIMIDIAESMHYSEDQVS